MLTHANPLVFVPVSAFPDMEDAIKKIVTTFLKSSRGNENLDSKSFRKMVSSNLGNIMAVKIIIMSLHSYLSSFVRESHVCFCLLQDTDSSSAIKEMQQGLDENNDGKVSFHEYMTLIGYVANVLSDRKTTEQKSN